MNLVYPLSIPNKNLNLSYLLFSQADLVKKEVLEELFRERITRAKEKQIPLDFWLILNPLCLYYKPYLKEIKDSFYYDQNRETINFKNNDYFCLFITNNPQYSTWLKLRIGYFEKKDIYSLIYPKEELRTEKEFLKKNQLKTNGLFSKICFQNERKFLFSSLDKKVHDSLLQNKLNFIKTFFNKI
jgi:hypothetical protein